MVIAQTARLRGDLASVRVPDELAVELELLTGHRRDLVTERTRGINRLRGLLTRIFPGLERCFDYSTLTGLAFVTRFAPPASIMAATDEEVYDHLREQGVRSPPIPKMIRAARAASGGQTIALSAEAPTALLVQQAATSLIMLTRQLSGLDKQIAEVFRGHRYAPILESVPGIGTLRRPQRYHRGLRKVFSMAALNSSQRDGPSRLSTQTRRETLGCPRADRWPDDSLTSYGR
ncbi:IS110 family transposase [Rhodococcus erythropolis]|uniref:IS110 family transposase n=1 Tax=Rhodococcus erythropolis TaxID=1833 RepID=UPI0030136BFF